MSSASAWVDRDMGRVVVYELRGVVHGPINAEDLVRVPGTPWVVTSGMRGPTVPQAHMSLIDVRDNSCSEIYPFGATIEHDLATYDGQIGPLEPSQFEPHGIDVGRDQHGNLCVYVVHHGVRESIEVFRIVGDLATRPRLTWVGALTLPHGVWGNDVASLPGGGLLVTSTTDISEGLEIGFTKSLSGEPTGKVVEWTPGAGWSDLPGSVMNSTNGVAASADGRWVFIGGWNPKNVVRVSRGVEPVQVDAVDTGIMTDNLTWSGDGRVLIAGCHETTLEQFTTGFYGVDAECRFPTRVIAVHPETLECEVLIHYGPEVFGVGTTATEIDDELWVGSMRFEGVARFGR